MILVFKISITLILIAFAISIISFGLAEGYAEKGNYKLESKCENIGSIGLYSVAIITLIMVGIKIWV